MNSLLRLTLPALLFAAMAIRAQTPSITGPALPGLERFDTAVLNLMTRFNSPGAQLAVSFNGRLLLARGYGLADREAGTPVQPDSLFRIGSVSKTFTSLATMVLIEQGRLTPDLKVFPYLGLTPFPGATNPDPRLQNITVQHLLQHSGGWDAAIGPDYLAQNAAIAAASGLPSPSDLTATIRHVIGQRLNFEPGTKQVYSNLGYVVLSAVVAKASGHAYADFVRSAILAKAGVTRPLPGGSLLADRHPGEVRYYDYPGAPLVRSVFPPTTAMVPAPYGGRSTEVRLSSGGWTCSAVDYVRMLCAIDGSNRGPAEIMTSASVVQWTSPPPANVTRMYGAGAHYGNGVIVTNFANGLGTAANWAHDGALPGSRSFMERRRNGVSYMITFNTLTADSAAMDREVDAALNPILTTFTPPAGNLFATARPEISALASRNVSAGTSITLAPLVTSVTSPTYQWLKDGVAIAGATTAALTLPNLAAASAGNYQLLATNAAGSTASDPATLSVGPVVSAGRLVNLSILTSLANPADSFTMGYVVGGSDTVGAKPLLVRAAGPSLGALGVPGTLADPKLELFTGAAKTGENDNWGGTPALANAMIAVGAFAYASATSRDAAAVATITSRDNSVKVTGTGAGAVIAELYDSTPASAFTATTPRLVNVSVLKQLGTSLTAGFVVGGTTPVKLLIRAVGPGLAAFGVGGTVADPQLALFSGANRIGENNDWGGTAELSVAFNQVGAFALPAGSKDAALLVTLSAGNYSVQVSGVVGTGTALVEVYEVP
jgi:CubicO group peptidase (beta-lactamase class C family)